MKQASNQKLIFIIKVLIATALLGAGAIYIVMQLMPQLSLLSAIFYAVAMTITLVFIMVMTIIISATFRQFILRQGGTDTQWLWFNSEPSGLQQIRVNSKAANDSE